ncbi:MAG: YbaB/EbfC family nucleoid-associated protein [Deltaproteobacteria bacterium]|nr:YbaB/EbfC family nucleoid-associated protein [Deltaproteobacteria bacterium]
MNFDELFGGGKMEALMQQAQALQKQVQDAQARAAQREVTGESGGGLVKVTATGAMTVSRVWIDPVTLTDKDMLEDLLTAAVNDALRRAKEAVTEEMGPLGAMAKNAGLGF